MKLLLEQLFYGRGERGYGILGASPEALSFRNRVEAICGAVGTPAACYDGEPFLLSVPEGGRVIMVCGRHGAPDSMKRETLFFHALIAEKTVLAAANANAFTLFDQGAFAGRLPCGEIQAVSFIANPGEAESAASCRASLPCFIRSDKPAPDAVRALVGMDANELTWATFAFQPLGGFDAQVIPPRAAAPFGASEYDASGNLVRAANCAQTGKDKPSYAQPSTRHDVALPSSMRQKTSAMLKVSLLANLFLVALCAALFVSRKAEQPNPTSSSTVGTDNSVKDEIENAAREAYRTRLLSIAPTNNLRDLPGFKSAANWQENDDPDRRQAFLTLLQIEALIRELDNPNKEKNNP